MNPKRPQPFIRFASSGCRSGTTLFTRVLTACAAASLAPAQTTSIESDVVTRSALTSESVTLSGNAELRLTDATLPLVSSTVDLVSENAWLVLTLVDPSDAIDGFLDQVRVHGEPAVLDENVRVMQHASGTAIVAQGPEFLPLQVFTGPAFTGDSSFPTQLTYHRASGLGTFHDAISSFKLKRGYMATFAENEDGTGISKVFIAQDGDLEVNVMPPGLDDTVSFVRIFPWAAVGKKGWSGGVPMQRDLPLSETPDQPGPVVDSDWLNLDWNYDWNNATVSTRSTEYIPMRHNAGWNSWTNINNKIGSTQVLGFNEPDRPDQANMTVDAAIALWPNLLTSGLRIGSPAPASANWTSNADWLGQFIEKADALNYRVDFVALHFYQANYSAQNLYDYLRAIHVRTRRPIWITEMNNGANWTDDAQPNLTQAENSTILQAFVQIMDSAPFVERYAIYNWVGDNRSMVLYDANLGIDVLTPAGEMYKAHHAPAAFVAEAPPVNDTRFEANYHFDGDLTDASGSASPASSAGTPQFVDGVIGQGLHFDGTDDHVQLPSKIAGGIDFTFASWVKWDGGATFQRIFDFGCDTNEYMFLTPNSGGNTLRFSITEGSYQNQLMLQTDPLVAGQWTHVAVTLKGNTGKLFVNGVKKAESTTMTINPVNLAAWSNYLGKSHFAADPHFAGTLDEVVISDVAFSDETIATMASNTPPEFAQTVIEAPTTVAGRYFRWSVADQALDSQSLPSELRFAKAGGPAWIGVLPDGTLYGTPESAGTWEVAVTVTDPSGSANVASVVITADGGSSLPESEDVAALYHFDGHPRSSVGLLHGQASGGPTYVEGHIGQAIALDGTNDYVQLPAEVTSGPGFTFGAWVRWDGGSSWQRIFDFGAGSSSYAFLTPYSGSATCRFAMLAPGASGEVRLESSTPLRTGVWTYVTVTMDGTTAKLYLDGVEADSTDLPLTPADLAATSNYLGKSQFSSDPYFNGLIDEVHLFHRALTGPEIAEIMAGDTSGPAFAVSPLDLGSATAGTRFSASIADQITGASGSLVFQKTSGAPWLEVTADGRILGTPAAIDAGPNRFGVRVVDATGRIDEAELDIHVTGSGSGAMAAYAFEGNADDYLGGANGLLSGTTDFVDGMRGQALAFDGSTTAVTLPAGVASSDDITIATWMRWDGGAIWQRLFDFGNSTDQYFFITPKSGGGTLRFAIKASAAAAEERLEVPTPAPGTWIHVALTLEGDLGRLYIDGREKVSGAILTDPSDLNPALLYLGDSLFEADPSFAGALDEFQIFDHALTANEIADLVGSGVRSAPETFAEWSERMLPTGARPGADSDGDGASNLAEFRLGLDPTDRNSAFRVHVRNGQLEWPSAMDLRFFVERNASLSAGGWETIDEVEGSDTSNSWPMPDPEDDAAFFRIRFAE
ncbi:hypothetical protein HNR46_000653 [Haloferula luteola]|uniref:Uncharacterized protein n=1 Tax=Haloferula luteola TaxID=595692 RepID=A0A840V9G9_9BACT|nr:LamG-like jellyroll fold domain-containing protein [Haloferula luteola]MBB5350429.1 hypothetical protein [Haloferula luteola]